MDTYVSLALIIVFLLICLIAFVVYKESGWKLVKKYERGHGHPRYNHEERERERIERERRERWHREHERDRYR